MINIKNILSRLIGSENVLSNNILFIDFTGSHEKAQFLSQLFYWSSRTKNPDGWFAKKYSEWFSEIRIKEHSLRRFTKEFVNQGFIETKFKKWNNVPTLHYKLDQDLLIQALSDFCEANKLSGSQIVRVDANKLSGSRLTKSNPPITETTTEITTEIKKETKVSKKTAKPTFKIPKTDEEVRALKIEIYTHLKSKMDERQIGGSKFWAKWVTNEFYDFYSGKDWKVSGRKMKSPKIAASRWFNGNLKRGDYAKICPDDPRYDPLNPWQKNTSERDTGEAEQVFKLYKGRKVYDDAKKELAPKVMRLLSQGIKLETFQAVFDYHAKNDYWRDIERMINQFETAKAAYDKSFNYAS